MKLLMGEGAQRVESYFDRARVQEGTSSGGAVWSSGSATTTPGSFGDGEEKSRGDSPDGCTDKEKTAVSPASQMQVGGSSSSRSCCG